MLSIKVEGLDKLVKKCHGNALLAKPLRGAFSKSVIYLESEVKEGWPVDTGRGRASTTHKVDGAVIPLWGKVGTDVKYAPFVEFGTAPHWPPLGAMQPWARRHGFPAGKQGAFLVARAIARHGTKGHYMFQKALEGGAGRVQGYFSAAAREIEGLWRG